MSDTPTSAATAQLAVARAVVPGSLQMREALEASQTFVRTRGEEGLCSDFRRRARVLRSEGDRVVIFLVVVVVVRSGFEIEIEGLVLVIGLLTLFWWYAALAMLALAVASDLVVLSIILLVAVVNTRVFAAVEILKTIYGRVSPDILCPCLSVLTGLKLRLRLRRNNIPALSVE